MMKTKHFLLLFSILVIFSQGSCRKESDSSENWEFYVIANEFYKGDSSSDTSIYQGTIEHGGLRDMQLLIRYSEDDSILLTVDEQGILSNFPMMYNYYKAGKFTGTDRLDLRLAWGGNGYGTNHTIVGSKR